MRQVTNLESFQIGHQISTLPICVFLIVVVVVHLNNVSVSLVGIWLKWCFKDPQIIILLKILLFLLLFAIADFDISNIFYIDFCVYIYMALKTGNCYWIIGVSISVETFRW